MLELFPHQKRILDENPKKALLVHEMRTGKSLIGAKWIDNQCRIGNTYIICLKANKKDWERYNTKAQVITKEEFKKLDIKNPTAIVVDEAHYFGSPLFLRKRSQLSEKLYKLLKQYPNCDVLLLTATPIRQDAWSLHTLLCYIGIYYDWKEWREKFFELKQPRYLRFPAWFPKSDWRENLKPIRDKHCDIVSLHDIVEHLPQPEERIITIKNKLIKRERWTDEHKDEQKGKLDEILNLGYKKMILVVYYTEQIDELAKELAKEKPVYILDGRTKNADEVKKQAQEADECYFIVQASMGFGFDGYMFGAIVFVSMMHSIVEYIQMTGRQRHLQHIITPQHIFLIGGKWDKRIYTSIKNNESFNPHHYE